MIMFMTISTLLSPAAVQLFGAPRRLGIAGLGPLEECDRYKSSWTKGPENSQ